MATLKKMTRMGADVRQIARLLQSKAPEGHMLAYITPEEAKLLKSQGGSGKEHEDTGIPSFEMGDSYGFTADTAFDYGPEPTQAYITPVQTSSVSGVDLPPASSASAPAFNAAQPAASFDTSQFASVPSAAPVSVAAPVDTSFRGPPTPDFLPSADRAALYGPAGYGAPASPTELAPFDTSREAPTIGQRYKDLAKSLGISEDTLGKAGIGGVQALLGAYQGRKAAEQGRMAKEEQQKLAQPYQTKGAELQRAAQAGELTPVGQQQLQAVQAQVAQQAAGRGGAVSAAQTQAQVENFRNQLLQQQYDYGLKLSGIGDQIALGAIKTGMQADQYVNQLTSSYYNNIARTLYGAPPQVAQQPTQGATNA
jgi:hypothetical protein